MNSKTKKEGLTKPVFETVYIPDYPNLDRKKAVETVLKLLNND